MLLVKNPVDDWKSEEDLVLLKEPVKRLAKQTITWRRGPRGDSCAQVAAACQPEITQSVTEDVKKEISEHKREN